jgi:hypothetical protein
MGEEEKVTQQLALKTPPPKFSKKELLGLERYDAMLTAIAECQEVDEVKDIHDKAKALEYYAAEAKSGEKWREDLLITLRANVKFYTDCTEPGKPVYHSLSRLAHGMPGWTGYWNSTAVGEWTEEKRIRRWTGLKVSARKRLEEFEKGKRKSSQCRRFAKRRHCRGSLSRMLQVLELVGDSGLTIHELYRQAYGSEAQNQADRRRIYRLVHLARKKGHLIENSKPGGQAGMYTLIESVYIRRAEPEFVPDLLGLS